MTFPAGLKSQAGHVYISNQQNKQTEFSIKWNHLFPFLDVGWGEAKLNKEEVYALDTWQDGQR